MIVGAGLAGACAAAVLALDREVTVVDVGVPGRGASGASAGLVNPFPGTRAAPAWRHDEALEAIEEVIALSGTDPSVGKRGLLRPARDAEQAGWFAERAAAHPHELDWLPPGALAERWPAVTAQHGGLWVKRGIAVDKPALVRGLLRRVDLREGIEVTDFGENDHAAWVRTATDERVEATTVILAPGDGFRHLPRLKDLSLGRVKGQTVRVRRPPELGPLPLLAGEGYVVPDGDSFVLGSTYERSFATDEPTAEGTRAVLEKAARLVPGLAETLVVDARAGIRVTVPVAISRRRLPLVGPVPGFRRVWLFIGLGSKGLLTAPLLARRLPEWMRRPETIPGEVSTVHPADRG